MKYEWRRAEKAIYGVKASPTLVTVPEQAFIMIDGAGNPNSPDFSERVSALYSLAYAVKMDYKKSNPELEVTDFTVYPLEGIWRQKEAEVLVKDDLVYTIMIAQPEFITREMVEKALAKVKVKKPNLHYDEIRFERMDEGNSIAMLHVGPFDTENQTFDEMERFCKLHKLNRISKVHREIYLNNLHRTDQYKLKTILRYQIQEEN